MLGADSLGYLDFKALADMVKGLPICTGCFDSYYPMAIPEPKELPFWCGE
jgi:amidophosphoribosyltransferase